MDRSTLFLTVGLPATGKTTAARRLEVEHQALRLTKDEWMIRRPDSAHGTTGVGTAGLHRSDEGVSGVQSRPPP